MHSKLFTYIKNQYLMGNFSNDDLIVLVELGRIREDERVELVALKVGV